MKFRTSQTLFALLVASLLYVSGLNWGKFISGDIWIFLMLCPGPLLSLALLYGLYPRPKIWRGVLFVLLTIPASFTAVNIALEMKSMGILSVTIGGLFGAGIYAVLIRYILGLRAMTTMAIVFVTLSGGAASTLWYHFAVWLDLTHGSWPTLFWWCFVTFALLILASRETPSNKAPQSDASRRWA